MSGRVPSHWHLGLITISFRRTTATNSEKVPGLELQPSNRFAHRNWIFVDFELRCYDIQQLIAPSRSLASFTLDSPLRLSNNTMIELSHSGTRIDMEWGEAALGCWLTGVHTRYVECDRLYNQFAVCGYSGTPCCFLLSSEYTSSLIKRQKLWQSIRLV